MRIIIENNTNLSITGVAKIIELNQETSELLYSESKTFCVYLNESYLVYHKKNKNSITYKIEKV